MTDRKAQILTAATTLLLQEGVGVSTARIAKAAGVANGTLFNVFPSKQILIDSLYLDAKQSMFDALPHSGEAAFTRAHLYENWCGYLAWARANPQRWRVMHLLLEAGLASQETQEAVATFAAPHAAWVAGALNRGLIRGPSLSFIGKLIFFASDLVLTENLHDEEADQAFDMMCASIGLTQ